ncbi:hypothetical protein B0T24DRAFT_571961 [Lasiosphaeria ovina]|uniref:Plasmid pRiA4b Orf3-like domain-containing protein n=1 Tax=Lasiosphaeria ovina TaxID=92902 RepID=A0AAE0KFA6_9PEZI|nr:hypothetical protein B0T24DRAFT_571961 [Lasiosphaeria ovina]
MSREFLLRVVDPVGFDQSNGFSGVDRVHEGRRRHPRTIEKPSEDFKLWQLFDDPKYQNHEIVYTYDFSDNWEHRLTITGRADATEHFAVLSGTGHPVAEDFGGVRGWQDLKAAYLAKEPTPEQRGRREWFETRASNADSRGLGAGNVDVWDMEAINAELPDMFDRFERMGQENEAQMQNWNEGLRTKTTKK